MMNLFYIGFGGFVGAVARYLVATTVQGHWHGGSFPMGTLSVNVMGCFLFGMITAHSSIDTFLSPHARLMILTGFLGSFTTYSTFGNDTVTLARNGEGMIALLYLLLHVVLGFAAVWFGIMLSERLG